MNIFYIPGREDGIHPSTMHKCIARDYFYPFNKVKACYISTFCNSKHLTWSGFAVTRCQRQDSEHVFAWLTKRSP